MLIGGPRGCVGYRFAIREIKTIIAVLLEAFQFDPRDKGNLATYLVLYMLMLSSRSNADSRHSAYTDTAVLKRTTFVARPLIQGEEGLGNQLPLKISLAPKHE